MIAHIYKGEIIECGRCKFEVGTIARDLRKHEGFSESDIRGTHYQPRNGDLCNCRECGAPWMNGGQLYIKGTGWV